MNKFFIKKKKSFENLNEIQFVVLIIFQNIYGQKFDHNLSNFDTNDEKHFNLEN